MAGGRRKTGSGKKSGGRGRGGFNPKDNRRYDRHDAYYRKAKREGFVARSVYKLEEIDEQLGLFKGARRVLDLGCAPGSWLQYAAQRVGPNGLLVGVDLLEVQVSFGSHVRIHQGDVFEMGPEELLGDAEGRFDLVLSDMAPNTTGQRSVDQARSMALCERAYELCPRVLRPGGNLCVKVLEGGDLPGWVKELRAAFDDVKIKRPKGTRAGSKETYVAALGYRPPADS